MHKHEWELLDREGHWEIWECSDLGCSKHKTVYAD